MELDEYPKSKREILCLPHIHAFTNPSGYEESFKLFDRNGDGVISKDELDYLMRSLGQSTSQAELDQTIEDIDQDGEFRSRGFKVS